MRKLKEEIGNENGDKGGRVWVGKQHKEPFSPPPPLFLSFVSLCPSSLSPPVPCPYQISEDAFILKVLLDISNNYVCVHVYACVCVCVCLHDSYGSLSSCSSRSMEHSCLATCWSGERRRGRERESGIRLEKESAGEGRKGGREVGEINSKECCGWMIGNKTQDSRA